MSPSWRSGFAAYADRRVVMVLLLGFSSGLPLLLTFSTLSAWLKGEGISRTAIGIFALVGTPYALKFLWSPLIDRLPLPVLTGWLGRRRSWGLLIQTLLIVFILALGATDPAREIWLTASLAVTVAFLSASQDIVIDAYRVEILDEMQQGPGAGAVQAGYRLAMLAAGAGALLVASQWGWFAAYATMAALLGIGMTVFLFGPEPEIKVSAATAERERRAAEYLEARPHLKGGPAKVAAWLYGAVVCPFADFMARPAWWAVLLFVIGYKMGEAMAGAMANTLYIEMGFALEEIAWVSKIFGFGATVAGTVIGGALVVRLGIMRALLVFGILQSLGNLFYVLQALAGHNVWALALCVAAENLTAGMAGSALVAYISGLCNLAYTATQYALLSSLTAVGRTLFASASGRLADMFGWVDFFLLTTVVTLPALLILPWLMRQQGRVASKPG
ncbi:major facilitator superfamily permease [Paramagnetospirillum caucaseum]|uniref:Major facilitator superfamily permease n=1 Tax=Paramagnetospirillum caucaseum TaxID=1244869 RepID=M3ACG2_9PROT|nr:AmpG family muropeptide MFS transporter [Paramagnetospirillum caucaseum]EME70488.1 major facilitator superfamily permease [Paramagnetospirillum caucaseum]